MRVTHTLTIIAKCPVDQRPDTYDVEITASRVIKVEDILDAAKRFAEIEIFQEDLTTQLARELGATVKTVGYHSTVRTEVIAS